MASPTRVESQALALLVVHHARSAPVKQSRKVPPSKLQAGEVVRFTNAAARMMDVYQNACLVLQKLKTKGTQHVLVQCKQVNVGDGGQSLVAGASLAPSPYH
jgi:hypothetical protein